MKPIVVLRCGDAVKEVAARRGEFAAWIQSGVGDAWRGEWSEHDLRTDAAPPSPSTASAFILTGSSSNVTEQAEWMLRAVPYLRELVASGTPVLGICFGHQILAHALGGHVTKNPRGREIGTVQATQIKSDLLWSGLGETFHVNATHVESAVSLPPGALLLGKTALEPHAAFAVGERVRCVQFHPEIDGDAMRGYIGARAHLMRAEGLDPEAATAAVHDADGAAILKSFVRGFVR
jgi:GMP synthase (glutamine-hydrolysing)